MNTQLSRLKTMPNASPVIFAGVFILLTTLLTVGIQQALQGNALGADFYVFWRSGRAFFLENQNPYHEDISQEIQLAVYKRLALPNEDPFLFGYPPYILVIILPLLWMEYDWAQAAWMALNLVNVLTATFLVFPRTPRWMLCFTPLFYNVLYGAGMGNFSLMISLVLFVFFGYFMIRRERYAAAQVALGFMLAWSTAKPQSIWLFLIFAVLFSYRERLWLLLRTFAVSATMLALLPFLLQPDWPFEWVSIIKIYADYTTQNRGIIALMALFSSGPFAAAAINTAFLVAAAVLLPTAALLIYQWWRGRVSDFPVLCGLAAITYLLLPNNSSADQMFLLMPFVLWCLWRGAELAAARWIWLAYGIYSHLVFFASFTRLVPQAIISGSLVFFIAWSAWLFLSKSRQKQV